MFLQLYDMIRRLVFILFSTSELGVTFVVCTICMPRGYGGVAVIWKNEIDHLVWPIQDGSEKIQAVEIQGKAGERLILISVYIPAKGSKNHQI
jgi:exonuclease III